MHGPIKTFGLAGLCDTVVICDDSDLAGRFESVSNRLHLTRNNVVSNAAFEAAYREGDGWIDGFLELIASNVEQLGAGLDPRLHCLPIDATYLAWIDLRALGLDVPDLAARLAAAGLALSPGHWFGREGAGFARMTIAVDPPVIDEAIARLGRLVKAVGRPGSASGRR